MTTRRTARLAIVAGVIAASSLAAGLGPAASPASASTFLSPTSVQHTTISESSEALKTTAQM